MQGKILASRYLLNRELGSGGMGAVYAATDLRTGGAVAVKLLHPTLSGNREYTARLRREAQIAASLTSPRVVRVIDLGTDDATGITYLVQEYVAGETLAARLLAQPRLPAAEALTIGREVARALEAAHRAGIVHRDLKPANIMLTDGQVKVLDFGIARAPGDVTITAADSYVGTPAYCAPEREEGGGDIRSDIYSFGVMLYEMLAGRRPFEGSTALRVMRQHAGEPPPPLPADVPPAARAVVERCLAKAPAERFQTPAELAAAIDAALTTPHATPEAMRTRPLPAAPAEPGSSEQAAGPIGAERPPVSPWAPPAQAAAGRSADGWDAPPPLPPFATAPLPALAPAATVRPPGENRPREAVNRRVRGPAPAPALAGGAMALLAVAAVGVWLVLGRGNGSVADQAGVPSPTAPATALVVVTPAAATVSASSPATPVATTRSPSPTVRPSPAPTASATPATRLTPQQLHQRLLDTPFAIDDFSLGLVPGAKERVDPTATDRRHNAVGAVSSAITGIWPLDDNSVRYTVFASDGDARARFDEGYTGSNTLVIHGPYSPMGMMTPARGYHATLTSDGQKFGLSYCLTVSGNVIVLGVSALDEITTQGSDETACLVARNALDHLRRVRGD